MARGYPDFFGFSIFPSFGIPTEEDSGGVAVVSGTSPILVNIAGKGRSYGGEIWYSGNQNAIRLTQVIVTLDGVVFNDEVPTGHITYGFHLDSHRFITLIACSLGTPTASWVAFTFGKDFTWGQTLTIALNNVSGADLAARCRYRWAQVR